jgi:hypothetical protein
MFKTGLKQKKLAVNYKQQLTEGDSTNFTTNNNQQLSPRTEQKIKSQIDAQTMILDYLGHSKEVILRSWPLICRAAYSFISQHSGKMFL